MLGGLKNLFLTIAIPLFMATLATCMGGYLLPKSDALERLTLGTALGMGMWGLAGFALAALELAKPLAILFVFIALAGYFMFSGKLLQVWKDAQYAAGEIHSSAKNTAYWIPISLAAAIILALLLGLAPPVEDFDGLFYHLTVPAWWLRDGGLTSAQMPHYWYPQIVEGSFVIPMSLGFDTSAHLIHLLWLILSILLLWHWMRQLQGDSSAWDVVSILLSMPSLLWLASWAYTDYALTFTGIASLYSLWKWKESDSTRWLFLGGIMAGMAISVKYTGFIVPLAGALLAVLWENNNSRRFKKLFEFSFVSLLAASPWYLRNWIWMGNPVYPFVFGGKFWDSFLDQAYSAPGSGIGFDPGQIILLPLTATLGTRDMNFFDGRIGPLFLILLPIFAYVPFQFKLLEEKIKHALTAVVIFSLLGFTAWFAGVISSAHLFQTRLLFPTLFPLTILLAVGWNDLAKLNLPRLNIDYIFRAMLAFVVIVNLLNFGLQALVRNPLTVAMEITSRRQYIEERQPDYASALTLIEKVPANAKVYFLFEPRSYGMTPRVQPDSINANFLHDLWQYKTPQNIVKAWKQQGYTHILLSNNGANFIFQNEPSPVSNGEASLKAVENLLNLVDISQNGSYTLYKIP